MPVSEEAEQRAKEISQLIIEDDNYVKELLLRCAPMVGCDEAMWFSESNYSLIIELISIAILTHAEVELAVGSPPPVELTEDLKTAVVDNLNRYYKLHKEEFAVQGSESYHRA